MDAISTAITTQTMAMAAQTNAITQMSSNLETHRQFTQSAVSGMTTRLEKVGDVLGAVADRIQSPNER